MEIIPRDGNGIGGGNWGIELCFRSYERLEGGLKLEWTVRFGIQFSFELTLFHGTDTEPASLYAVSLVAEIRVLSGTSGTGVFPNTTLSYTVIHNIFSLFVPSLLDKWEMANDCNPRATIGELHTPSEEEEQYPDSHISWKEYSDYNLSVLRDE